MRNINSAVHSCTCSYSKPDSIDTDHGADCAMVIAAITPDQCVGQPQCRGRGHYGHARGICPYYPREQQIRAEIRAGLQRAGGVA